MSRGLIAAAVLAVLAVVGLACVFVVDERRQALVLAFGRVERVESEPGLKFKLPPPFNTVEYYEDRILPLETTALEVTPLDDRRLVVDVFAHWRITVPGRFRESVQSMCAALSRLETILNAALREVLGSETSGTVLSGERTGLMHSIRDATKAEASALGETIINEVRPHVALDGRTPIGYLSQHHGESLCRKPDRHLSRRESQCRQRRQKCPM